MIEKLSGKTVLVTGATGFIGGRLVERLVSLEGARVRALVHTMGNAVRIARLPIELIRGDLLDLDSLRSAAQGCDVMFHCAYGSRGNDEQRRQVNVDGTRNVLQAALEAGVRRVVHFSTVAVHDAGHCEKIDETRPYATQGDVYTLSKIEAEKLAFAYQRDHGLKVVVLRPPVVYGPYAPYWTVAQIQRIKNGSFTFVEDGQGTCNPIYVDDIVAASTLAAVHPDAKGEAFIIANNPTTWHEFFDYYLQMVGQSQVPNWQMAEWQAVRRAQRVVGYRLGRQVARLGSPRTRQVARRVFLLGNAYALASNILPYRLKKRVLAPFEQLYRQRWYPDRIPNPEEVAFFSAQTVYNGRKAKECLGFQPRVSLERGMRLTEQWLNYKGLV